ncbi:MAG: hypothetical protein ABSH09_02515 [Bryobacteraceae bacterium]|jgi:hypothetical protein
MCVAVLCSLSARREADVWRSDWIAREQTPQRLRAALVYAPGDATKWRELGVLLLRKGMDSKPAFERALDLNRFESDALLGLAIDAESHGFGSAAESSYIQAIGVSRCFRPKYALAAFYARAGRREDFWRIAAAAANIDQADIGPVERLARDAGADPDEIPTLLHLNTEHALSAYLTIALSQNRPKPLAEVALRLPATRARQPALLEACGRLIEAGTTEAAVAVWNHVGIFQKLDPAAGRSLTNTAFSYSAVRGFNWRSNELTGVQIRAASTGLRIELTGEQPEHALLLEQIVPVLARRKYRFSVRSGAPEASTQAGIAWQIQCAASPEIIASGFPASTTLNFTTPAGCTLIRASLVYNRQLGTVRIATTFDLLSAELELLR